MYAPVVTRLLTYAVALDGDDQAYCQAVMAHPSMAEWVAAAKREPWIIDKYEI
jgi:glutathione S-transferase